jgi:hypothetical protein
MPKTAAASSGLSNSFSMIIPLWFVLRVSASPTLDGVVSALAVKGTSCPADSLRSPLTARPETRTWLVVGEAEVVVSGTNQGGSSVAE